MTDHFGKATHWTRIRDGARCELLATPHANPHTANPAALENEDGMARLKQRVTLWVLMSHKLLDQAMAVDQPIGQGSPAWLAWAASMWDLASRADMQACHRYAPENLGILQGAFSGRLGPVIGSGA